MFISNGKQFDEDDELEYEPGRGPRDWDAALNKYTAGEIEDRPSWSHPDPKHPSNTNPEEFWKKYDPQGDDLVERDSDKF